MLNFNEYFEDQYQFSLENVSFNSINSAVSKPLELKITDSFIPIILDDGISVKYTRHIHFEPAAVFAIVVSLNFRLKARPDKTAELPSIDWSAALKGENANIYWSNIISRASNIIANLTSSYGQAPIVTPSILLVN